MNTAIVFFGTDPDCADARDLCALCVPQMTGALCKTAAVTDGRISGRLEFEAAAVPADYTEPLPQGIRTVTWSADNQNADVAALNIEKRESGTRFEILTGNSMGRIFVSERMRYSVRAVLLSAAALYCAGAEFDEVLEVLNGILR